MSHLLTPQIQYPFRIQGGEVSCIEQDSSDDIFQNAITVMRYREGERSNLPEFGIPDPVFAQNGISGDTIATAVRRWEPDATVEEIDSVINNAGEHKLDLNIIANREV